MMRLFSMLSVKLGLQGNTAAEPRFSLSFNHALMLTACSALVALILGFGCAHFLAIDKMFAYGSYYFFWVTFLFLLAAGIERDHPSPFTRWQRRDGVLLTLLAVGATAVTFASVGMDFRVLADENNLLSTSRSLFYNHSFYNLLQAEPYYGYWTFHESALPVRPGGYPFLIYLLHAIRGFSAYHGFAVNFAAAAGLMLVLIRLGENLVARPFGMIAGCLLASFPLYQLVVTSSGYDALNLLGIMTVLWLLHGFIAAPSARRLELLTLTAVLAGQVRYESILLCAPIGLAVLYHLPRLRAEKFSWRFPLLPLLLLPIAWQRQALGMNALLQDGETNVFATHFFAKNARGAFNLFLNFAQAQFPRSEIVVVLGLIGIVMVVALMIRRRLTRTQGLTIAFAASALVPLTIVQLMFYNGDVSTAFAMRMAMVYLGAASFFAAYPLWWLLRNHLCSGKVIALALAALFLHELPVAARNDVGKSLTLFREFKNVREVLEKRPGPLVVVSDRPILYISLGYGGLGFNFVKANTAKIKRSIKMHLYDVYAVLNVPEDKPPKQELPADFRQEIVQEWQNEADITVRLVQLFPTDPPKPPPAAEPAPDKKMKKPRKPPGKPAA